MGVASADVDPGQAGPEKRSVFLSRARSEREIEREGERRGALSGIYRKILNYFSYRVRQRH